MEINGDKTLINISVLNLYNSVKMKKMRGVGVLKNLTLYSIAIHKTSFPPVSTWEYHIIFKSSLRELPKETRKKR